MVKVCLTLSVALRNCLYTVKPVYCMMGLFASQLSLVFTLPTHQRTYMISQPNCSLFLSCPPFPTSFSSSLLPFPFPLKFPNFYLSSLPEHICFPYLPHPLHSLLSYPSHSLFSHSSSPILSCHLLPFLTLVGIRVCMGSSAKTDCHWLKFSSQYH